MDGFSYGRNGRPGSRNVNSWACGVMENIVKLATSDTNLRTNWRMAGGNPGQICRPVSARVTRRFSVGGLIGR
jgi:hypothetical protein